MKSPSMTLLLFLMAMVFHQAHCQVSKEEIIGSWQGTLNTGGAQLRLVFNISIAEDAQFKATMDSPDQGAMGVPMGEVNLEGDSIRIDAPMIMGYYRGKVTSKTTIVGTWNQGNMSFVLNLVKQTEAVVLNRPQEPKPPFPYIEEEVSFENREQHFSLGGTFTIPEGEGPFPAVILVTGSGNQNRDEEIFGHKPFRLIADHLTREGIAVLRYDDRGVGSSGGNFVGSTSADYAGDARAAIEYLFERAEVDQSKVGVIGHSEGGMIAFMLASEYDDIAFIISLAGPGVDGKTILLEQSDYITELSGVEESIREDNRIVMSKVYELMISNESHEEWGKKALEFTSVYYSAKEIGGYSEEEIEQSKKNLLASVPEDSYAWMRYFVMFDPSSYFVSIKCPVLALNGEKDCQVLAQKNVNAIREDLLASGNQTVTTMILPGLNHLFQNCETGLPGEYGLIEETFDQKTLDILSDWLLQLFPMK